MTVKMDEVNHPIHFIGDFPVRNDYVWDGHDNPEKYKRLASIFFNQG